MLRPVLFATACAGLACTAGPALAELDDAVANALALYQAGRSQDAFALLIPLQATRAGDADYDLALGIAAADSGHPAEAVIALQRVLAIQPDNAQARAELARAYALAGDIDTARAEFDTAMQDPSLPDPVRQRFDQIVRNYDRQIAGGGSDVSGFLDLTSGFDSNVNAATDLDSIVIPLFAGFGPGQLGANAQATDAAYLEAVGGISAVSGVSRQTRLFGSLLANIRENLEAGFDQAAATGTAGVAHTLANRDVVSLSVQGQQFWLGGDSFRQAIGVIGQYTHRLEGGRALSVSGEVFRQNFDNDPLRDSNRYGAGVTYAARTFVLSAAGGREETRRSAGDHLSYTYGRANLAFELPAGDRVAVVGGIGGQIRGYDADDPLFLTAREDEQLDASLGLKFRMTGNVYARPRVTYTRNWSNIALYDYERFTASFGIRAEF
ncbi:DUF560 domain-containing protein [Aurantiacibacter xanthus]|uniref:DUF560 domain-containing protein n=1 Tax=Aurantiacibacter xanthus TaxID=1784712 RepID=A0A3A1PCE8_9SPHN|nr:tetratricopeptide repeat protein [Aurantiacibacter xanthus]RIV91448.1 DUF560 domain-containing protein [Aurantiacibacter xanthus]